jgi:hypothetical protein
MSNEQECRPIGPNTVCIEGGCPHWSFDRKCCTFYEEVED